MSLSVYGDTKCEVRFSHIYNFVRLLSNCMVRCLVGYKFTVQCIIEKYVRDNRKAEGRLCGWKSEKDSRALQICVYISNATTL